MRARTRENRGAKINAKMMKVRSQMLAFFFCRMIGKLRKEYLLKYLILLCVLFNIRGDSRKNFTFRLIFHALPLFQPLYK